MTSVGWPWEGSAGLIHTPAVDPPGYSARIVKASPAILRHMALQRPLAERLQVMNPWLSGSKPADAGVAARPPRWIPREQVDLSRFSDPRKAHLLVGPRQAGKSTLAWEFVRPRSRPLLVNCEEPLVRPWCRSAAGFLADLPSLMTEGPDVLFLEEIQRLDDAEKGALTKNWVFTELAKALPWTQTIRYWRSRSGAEVDFVVPRHDRLLGIEVKANRMRRPKLSRSSRSFIEAYEPSGFWVLNEELEHDEALGPTTVRWRRLTDLPELIAGWLTAERE